MLFMRNLSSRKFERTFIRERNEVNPELTYSDTCRMSCGFCLTASNSEGPVEINFGTFEIELY